MNQYLVKDSPILSEVGTKAYNLHRLKINGFKVPPFLILQFGADKPDMEQLNKELKSVLHGHFRHGSRLAVRSSASMEDSETASFAGQFKTFLNIPAGDVIRAVVGCLQSLNSESVRAYLKKKNIAADRIKMSVIIQEMVKPEIAGVLFSVNPRGLLSETVITIGKGSGEDIVRDKVPVTTYYCGDEGQFYYEQQTGAPLLDKSAVSQLLNEAGRAVTVFGPYIDIEFTIHKKELFFLQVRDITTISKTERVVLDNSNIVESYPGITLPLTISFAKEAYYQVFRGAMLRGLRDRRLVSRYDVILQHMVEAVNGRVYYQISNWYALMQFLPFNRRFLPIWQKMLGIRNQEQILPESVIKKTNPVRDCAVCLRSLRLMLFLPRKMSKLNRDFQKTIVFFTERFNHSLSSRQALALYHNIKKQVLRDWDLTLSNDIYTFVFNGLLTRRLAMPPAHHHETVVSRLPSSLGGLESVKPLQALVNLTALAIRKGIIPEISAITDEVKLLDYFTSNPNDFTRAFNEFISNYGDCTPDGLKLESPTYRSEPVRLLSTITTYAEDPARLARLERFLVRPKAAAESQSLLVNFYRRQAAIGIANREQSRINRSRIFGMVRMLFDVIGTELCGENRLDSPRDIFYLTVPEVERLVKDSKADYQDKINQRKTDYEMFRGLPECNRLVFAGGLFDKRLLNINSTLSIQNADHFIGTPCSHGVVEGEALVVETSCPDVPTAEGKILVVRTTDPGWVFVLAVARGIIAERGSILSHSAIISRELGLPSVVGVTDAISKLHSGEIIRLDGDIGRVEVIK
jgi:pyruvate,water dikinase